MKLLAAVLSIAIVGGSAAAAPAAGMPGARTSRPAESPADAADLLALRPGALLPEVERTLDDLDLDVIPIDARTILIATPMLAAIFEPQRTVLRFDELGRLSAVHVQVEPEGGAAGREILRLYADVRAELTRALGRPAWELAEGYALPGDIVPALSDGGLVRYLQWEDHANVRAGIPRRVDGRVFVEVVITAERLPRHEPFWGLSGF